MTKFDLPPLLGEALWLAGSFRMLADSIGLPLSTVHGWARHGRVSSPLARKALADLIAHLRDESIIPPPYHKPGSYPK